jgi:hypothetical protein
VIKRIYVLSAKTYIADFILYSAMCTPETDIFYQDINCKDWGTLLNCYTYHEFEDNKKVVKAYKNFYNYVAIGNAMKSKLREDDMAITKMIKHGLYGTYYFLNKKERID